MATQYTTTLMAAISQEILRTDIRPQFQRAHPEFSLMKQVTDTSGINSRGYQVPVYLEPESSQVWGAEGFTHPAGSTDTDRKMTALIARYAKGFEFSGDMLAFDKPSARQLLKIKDRFQRLKKNIFVEWSKLFYGDGSGVLGVVDTGQGAVVTGASGSVYLSTTVAASSAYPFATFGAALLTKGMSVDVLDTTLATNRGTATVDAKLTSSRVTLSTVPAGTVNTDVLVPSGSAGYAFKGLAHHIVATTGSYQGLTRTGGSENFPQLKARVYDNSALPLTYGLMNFMEEIATFRADPENLDSVNTENVIMTSTCQYSKARQMGANLVRYMGGDTTLTQGFDKVKTAQGGLWKEFTWCPEHAVYFVHKPDFVLINAQELDFTNYGNNGDMVWSTTTSGGGRRDAAYGSISWKGQFVGLEPRNQGAIVNLEMTGPRRHSYDGEV